jgi:hypothetical protein
MFFDQQSSHVNSKIPSYPPSAVLCVCARARACTKGDIKHLQPWHYSEHRNDRAAVQLSLHGAAVKLSLTELQYNCHYTELQYNCHCTELQYNCHCTELQYNCHWTVLQYNCHCTELQYNCHCTVLQYNCHCTELQYNCHCTVLTEKLQPLLSVRNWCYSNGMTLTQANLETWRRKQWKEK